MEWKDVALFVQLVFGSGAILLLGLILLGVLIPVRTQDRIANLIEGGNVND
jgi:hypothetical protein